MRVDLLVVGWGVNGLALAVAAARLLGLRVAVAGSGPPGGLAGAAAGGGPAYSVGLAPRDLAEPLGIDLEGGLVFHDESWVVVEEGEGRLLTWHRSPVRLLEELAGLAGRSEATRLLGILSSWRRCAPRILTPRGGEPGGWDWAVSLAMECGGSELAEAVAEPPSSWAGPLEPLLAYPTLSGEPGLATLYFNTSMGVWGVPRPGAPWIVESLLREARRLGVALLRGRARFRLTPSGYLARLSTGRNVEAGMLAYAANVACLGDAIEGPEWLVDEAGAAARRALPEGYRGPDRYEAYLDLPWREAARLVAGAAGLDPARIAGEGVSPVIEVWGRDYWVEAVARAWGSGARVSLSGYLPPERIWNALEALGLDPSLLWRLEDYGPGVQGALHCNPQGNPNHLPMTREYLLDSRPAPGWRGVRGPAGGFYVASASAHPGGQITLMPAFNALQALARDLGVYSRVEAVLRGAWERGYRFPGVPEAEA